MTPRIGSSLADHLARLLEDSDPVRRPPAMEAERDANRQPDRRDRFPAEVPCVEDHDVAEVTRRVIDIRHDPAFVLDGRGRQ